MGSVLFYGLIAIGAILLSGISFYFIFWKIIKTYLYENEGWYIFGLIGAGLLGFTFAGFFIIPVCGFNKFGILCSLPLRFILTIAFALGYWKLTQPMMRNY